MFELPRFALGTVQAEADLCPLLWGLLDSLEQSDWHVQAFQSSAHLTPKCGVRCITGKSQRHLDSWMMSRATCREIFEHGARSADLSVVAGSLLPRDEGRRGGHLDLLSDWLDLPRLCVLDVARLDRCRLPAMPPGVAGLFLDRVPESGAAIRWWTWLEAYYGVPVVGMLPEIANLRSLVGTRNSGSPCRELCRAIGERLESTLRLDRLVTIAQSRPWTHHAPRIFARQETDDPIQVAVAFDEAFQGYFADTLDVLEARGARIGDFSAVRSEALPWDTDVVYLAGLHTEQQAEALANNVCMKQALRNFVAQGGLIYAEGGGLAYLCERMVLADGREYPMTGLIPAIAVHRGARSTPRPVELTFGPHCWLGGVGAKMLGYTDDAWSLMPSTGCLSFAQEPECQHDLVGQGRVIGSRLQVDFAGQPHLLASFFRPRLDALVGAV
jgi:cobyrinic acid a,c-diamide synthase